MYFIVGWLRCGNQLVRCDIAFESVRINFIHTNKRFFCVVCLSSGYRCLLLVACVKRKKHEQIKPQSRTWSVGILRCAFWDVHFVRNTFLISCTKRNLNDALRIFESRSWKSQLSNQFINRNNHYSIRSHWYHQIQGRLSYKKSHRLNILHRTTPKI